MATTQQPSVTEVSRVPGAITWALAGDTLLECRAHALLDPRGGTWLIDPLDADGLDALLAPLGPVRGVLVLLDRHLRQAPEVAARHDAPLLVPPGRWRRGHPAPTGSIPLDRAAAELDDPPPFTFAPLVQRDGQWLEWLAWAPEHRLLVVPEVLGTPAYYAPRSGPSGLHPALRMFGAPRHLAAPGSELRDQLAAAPLTALVGHGDVPGTHELAELERPLAHARRGLPSLAVRLPGIAIEAARARSRSGARSGC